MLRNIDIYNHTPVHILSLISGVHSDLLYYLPNKAICVYRRVEWINRVEHCGLILGVLKLIVCRWSSYPLEINIARVRVKPLTERPCVLQRSPASL